MITATKINEVTRMKLMKKNSIGAFPNMTMFNQISDLAVRRLDVRTFGCINQEINNQIQMLMMMNNFSKYFDVLLMINDDDDDDKNQQENNNDTNKMMAILNIVLNDDKEIIQNSNNKKLTNNCKIEINTENINFSYYCDEYYEIIFNVSVFLSQKFDIMQLIDKDVMMNSSIIRMMANKLQSHIQSFIVTDHDYDDDDDDNEKIMEKIIMMISKSSISSQSKNTNKSEYAFEKTLNNDNEKFYVANVKDIFSVKSMTMMESTSKLFLSSHFFSFFMQLLNPMMNKIITKQFIQSYIRNNYFYDDDDDYKDEDDDAGYIMMISNVEMQLNCQKSLQSYKESDQQSGIVSNTSCNNIKLVNIINSNGYDDGAKHNDVPVMDTMMDLDASVAATSAAEHNNAAICMPHARMNISELLFSHINDKNETLIDNTVNITCDFNYLNYKHNDDKSKNNNYKINDQIRKDDEDEEKTSVKEANYNNITDTATTVTMEKSTANDFTTECGRNATTTGKYQAMTQIDMLIECQQREKALIKQYEAMTGRRLRLCGGGGDSLSGNPSGWGSPPSNSNTGSNPNAGQWGATAQQTPQQNWNQAAQQASGGQASGQQPPQQVQQQQQNAAVGQPQPGGAQGPKPLTPSGGWNQPPNPNQVVPQQQVPPGNGAGIVGGGTSAVAAKNQLEQLNSMREALFAQDGWGCQNVNQDTNWDVPGSPEPGPRGDPSASAGGATQWKSHAINNGTELWEANLRNGGQPPPQPVQKTPWNHTPTTNIGGTWGEEDDDSSENTNVWAANQNNPQAPGWNQNASSSANNSGNMWPAAQGTFAFSLLISLC